MICSIENCKEVVRSRGWCSKHYQRWRHHGDAAIGSDRTKPGEPARFISEVALVYDGDDCLNWPFSTNPAGYGKISVNGKLEHVNRVVCEAVHGSPPTPEHEAAHSCGKGHFGCISPKHLSWKTPSENQQDKVAHGTDNRGAKHPLAKLTEDDVRAIRSMRGVKTQQELADQFHVDRRHIGLIQQRKTWKYLDADSGAFDAKRKAAA